ncbi:MAG: transposase [Rikenellaceae bacterium]
MGVKHYDKQFKERAVKLSCQRDSIRQAADELGVSSSQLSKWRKDYTQYGDSSFPGRGVERLTDEQREIKRLQKELRDKELDIEILKNAIAFFSRADK